uniref:DUF3037 domain-containing protein n=1 Tax=Listeria valentina TaxID=2705293 RepID=UPI00142FB33D
MRVEYSILRYTPDIYIGEAINVGIAYHNLETDQRDFKIISNYKRLWAFDDELDPEFTTQSIEGFANDWVMGNLFSRYHSLREYTRFFVNEFYFSEIKIEDVGDYKEFIVKSSKFFFRKSLPKSERLSKKQRIDFLESFLNKKIFSFRKKEKLIWKYKDGYTFEYYIINNGNPVGIKYI